MSHPKVAVFIPAYKRPEYTQCCVDSINEAQEYHNVTFFLFDEGANSGVFERFKRKDDVLIRRNHPQGLRNTIIEFFNMVRHSKFEYLCKIDNDCIVPKNWLDDLIAILKSTNVDILSPNVSESQAAIRYGKDDTYGLGYRPSSVVGGLWNMERRWIDNLYFEEADTRGIRGAFALLHQIIVLNEPRPRLGWTDKVTFQDIGYWGGSHPLHKKTKDHADYSSEVGRPVNWNVEAGR